MPGRLAPVEPDGDSLDRPAAACLFAGAAEFSAMVSPPSEISFIMVPDCSADREPSFAATLLDEPRHPFGDDLCSD
jgi:hypothetical protein